MLKVGDPVEARFVGVDRKSRAITLSIKAIEARGRGRGGAAVSRHGFGDRHITR